MKKMIISMLVLIAWTTSLRAQITREQADAIVLEHIQNEVTQPHLLYVNVNSPNAEGITIETRMREKVNVKHACLVYFLDENPDVSGPSQRRYLFVKKDNGNLLEIKTRNDYLPNDIDSWKVVEISTGLNEKEGNNLKPPYPNPVDDWLTLPSSGDRTRVEIYDLKGTRLFSGLFSGKNAYQLNVSFLNAGVYIVNVSGETGTANYKIIKN